MTVKPHNKALKLTCLDAAIEHFGSKAKLSLAMKTSNQNVQNWIIRGTIPTKKALLIERESGGAIKARDILLENDFLDMGKVD